MVQRQLCYNSHVIRMPENRLRQILYGEFACGRRSPWGRKNDFKDHLQCTRKNYNIRPSSSGHSCIQEGMAQPVVRRSLILNSTTLELLMSAVNADMKKLSNNPFNPLLRFYAQLVFERVPLPPLPSTKPHAAQHHTVLKFCGGGSRHRTRWTSRIELNLLLVKQTSLHTSGTEPVLFCLKLCSMWGFHCIEMCHTRTS